MTDALPPVSETTLGHDIFGPLWAAVDVGSVRAAGRPVTTVSPAAFAEARGDVLARVLELVRRIGRFQPGTMAIFHEAGWPGARNADEAGLYLLLHAGAIEDYPPDMADPAVVDRMLGMGGDLVLTAFLHALVGAAGVRGGGLAENVPLVAEAVRLVAGLLGRDGDAALRDTFRMWRVAHLPGILRPDAPTPAAAKATCRAYAHALGDAIGV
ncbi:hypothetical protein ACL02R_22095 [Streptomyces sp. MS19]|uniref:hypothetical protein n=1 Tax=Streptomyces sp. MS19 TaxID=3385972 RepID=UPI0039A1B776